MSTLIRHFVVKSLRLKLSLKLARIYAHMPTFLPRDSADCAVARCMSVCPSVRLSHAGILSKRLNISSNFFHHPVTTPF